jgi:hypothetical protein
VSVPTTFRRTTLAVALAISVGGLAGCATTPTPYQPMGSGKVSGGYSDTQLAPDRYRVTFVGNDYTSRKTVDDYLLYRAAQLTAQNGYQSFKILTNVNESDVETQLTPDPLFTGPYGWWRPAWRYYGPAGWRSWNPWTGDPFWADTVDVSTVTKYEAQADILMQRGPATGKGSFNANQVLTALGPTIQLPKS